jgi:N-acylneuraminate cytidylyltransferase
MSSLKIAVIPARGGSKRIPGKNIKPFAGKPIIAYSIEAALESGCFDHVIVSTDDQEIAQVAMSYGAEVPFVRPKELADDHSGTLPVIKHAIEWFAMRGKSPEYVCCIYATAPFLNPSIVNDAFQQLRSSGADYCFTVTSFPFPIQRALSIRQQRLEMFHPQYAETRSQDLTESYHDAGQLYWGRAQAFETMKPLFSSSATPFILPRYRVQDIDTPEDWQLAEMMYTVLCQSGEL